MKIYGLDLTSAPSRRKPLVALLCTLEDDVLLVEGSEEITDFFGFDGFLAKPGPWVCETDFPFGQPRSLVSALVDALRWKVVGSGLHRVSELLRKVVAPVPFLG